jgi:phenylacetate-CoA ligase
MVWNKEETGSRSEMQALQLGRLQKTVSYVYEKDPHNRKKLDEAGVTPQEIRSLDDIRRLPFTTKQDIRDNYPLKLFTATQEEIVEYHATSGTTGKPVVVGYTRQDLETWKEVMARALTGAGITSKDVVQNIYGYGLFTGGLGAHYGAIRVGAAVIPISGGNTQKQLMLMEDFGSTALTSTPSFLMHLHEVGEEQGVDFHKLKLRVGVLGAEPWSEAMRQQIQDKFGIKACDIYGLSEIIGPGVAFECVEKQHGLHINEDYFYPEIIDPQTCEVLPEGEVGELVFTTIANQGQPLLRFRTRDITRLSYGTCVCGRTTVMMERVTGRSDDMLIIRGVNVFPTQIEEQVLKVKQLSAAYELHVYRNGNLDSMDVLVELKPEHEHMSDAERSAVSRELAHHIKSNVGISTRINICPCFAIKRSEGKAARVVDKRKSA